LKGYYNIYENYKSKNKEMSNFLQKAIDIDDLKTQNIYKKKEKIHKIHKTQPSNLNTSGVSINQSNSFNNNPN
jgi:hypothetical protein